MSLLEETLAASHGTRTSVSTQEVYKWTRAEGDSSVHCSERHCWGGGRGRYGEVVLARLEIWIPARLCPSWTEVTEAKG